MTVVPQGITENARQPIMVLGFGRSGSTWVADVISRLGDGLMLNEPLNPGLLLEPGELIWRSGEPDRRLALLLRAALNGAHRAPWLMRAFFAPLGEADHRDIAKTWDASYIIGFKDTHHCCFGTPWLVENFGRKLAFVRRDCAPVVASVLARPSFWAWGWPAHYRIMLNASVLSPTADDTPLAELRPFVDEAQTHAERIAILWAAVDMAATLDCRKLGIQTWEYDRLKVGDDWPELCDVLGVRWKPDLAAIATSSRTVSPTRVDLNTATLERIERIAAVAYGWR